MNYTSIKKMTGKKVVIIIAIAQTKNMSQKMIIARFV